MSYKKKLLHTEAAVIIACRHAQMSTKLLSFVVDAGFDADTAKSALARFRRSIGGREPSQNDADQVLAVRAATLRTATKPAFGARFVTLNRPTTQTHMT
jgi:hypothetical protein